MNHNPSPSPLKVTILSRHIKQRGGLEKWAIRIAESFSKKGAFVTMLTSDTLEKNEEIPLVSTQTLPLRKWLNFQKLKEFDHLVQQWNQTHPADIIFGMDRTTDQTHLRAGNGVHAAYLENRQAFEDYPLYKKWINPLNHTILKLEKKAFENPKLKVLFVNSYMVKDEILKHYQVSSDKIEVIHNGAPWEEMQSDFLAWGERKKKECLHRSLDPTLYHFLFIGNGYERKGLYSLLNGLKALKTREFHLSIIGKDRNMKTFIKHSKALGLEKQITFFGPTANIRPFLQMGDCLVIPSHYDPFANVTVEALSMGLFVVSSKNNGGYEILSEETGEVIEDLSSIDSIKASLERALQHPKTKEHSKIIRNSVKHLDFQNQLASYINRSLET